MLFRSITSVRYDVIINGLPTNFFEAGRGLRQGCALSSLIFILVMNGFSTMMHNAEQKGYISGFSFSDSIYTSHSLFVDDMLLFGRLVRNHWFYVHFILTRFGEATRLCINKAKSFILYEFGDINEISFIAEFLGVNIKQAVDGFQYLGYRIKPCGYKNRDWLWMVDRFREKINKWTHRWLKLGGRLIMIQAVLSQLILYWGHLFFIPEMIIDNINRIIAQFIWRGIG